ncbi:MAG: HAMP domain-containing histidine kinase [Clostridiales bacterium]|nr:HAMP domain-containing histidine kinase [Clostridiales bacterium]
MFFVLAFIFTTLMLDRWQRVFFLAAELAAYISCFFVEHFMFGQLANFDTNMENMLDILAGLVGVGSMLVIIVTLHIRIHNRQRRKLDEQNAVLAQASRAKTEFLQDIGHEIRNPLQVISYGVDFMRSRISQESGTEEMLGALNAIQEEAVRLGLMINGMVELATMSGNPASRVKVDFAAMLRRSAETLRIEAESKHNVLHVHIGPDLPPVYAVTEQLERVPINLLQNAMNATECGVICLEAFFAAGGITVKIRDNGTGIAPELLPHVFERGVSGRNGKGYGLSICKTIVEAHSGVIEIESEPGKGTTATFTVPIYGGQGEAREHE